MLYTMCSVCGGPLLKNLIKLSWASCNVGVIVTVMNQN
jgi:hypothetical protein